MTLVGLAIAVVSSMVACSSDSANPRKLDLLDPPSAEAEAKRTHQMQAVRVIDDKNGGEIVELDPIGEVFVQGMIRACPASPSLPPCEELRDMTHFRRAYCLGEIDLAIATGVEQVTLTFNNCDENPSDPSCDRVKNEFQARVLPQSAATNAVLAQRAFNDFYSTVFQVSGAVINTLLPIVGPTPFCSLDDLRAPDNPSSGKVADGAAALFVDSYHLALKSLDLAVKNTLAVSDTELTSTPVAALAEARGVAAKALSRAAAAHMILGGDEGLNGSVTQAFCTTPELTAQATVARDALRRAGLPPWKILATNEFRPGRPEITMENLLEKADDSTSVVDPEGRDAGSVRQRLEEFEGVTIPSNFNVPQFLGLTLDDFKEARRRMAEEIVSFHRSDTAKLPPTKLTGGRVPKYDRFIATATPPPERDPTFFAAMARHQQFTQWRTPSGDPDPRSLSFAEDINDMSSFVDWAQTLAGWFASRPEILADDALRASMAPLSLLTQEQTRRGRLVHCQSLPSQDASIDDVFTVNGFDKDARLVLVAGEDSLECAVTGTIEGAPCSMNGRILAPFDTDTTPAQGFDRAAKATPSTDDVQNTLDVRWYVLQPKNAGAAIPVPGGYRALQGFEMHVFNFQDGMDLPATRCEDVPIVPELDVRGGSVLAPSRDWCARPTVTCAGTRFDERLPLEDELSQDDNGIESSWKHYLALARQAANESDLLGKEYVEATLDVERRGEELSLRQQQQQERAAAELDKLQAICGTSVDTSALLDEFGKNQNGALDLTRIDQGACQTVMPENTTCTNGRAILGWLKVAQSKPTLTKLGACMAEFDDNIKFMQLGTEDLCLWLDGEKICGGDHPGQACPALKDPIKDATGAVIGKVCPAAPAGTQAEEAPAADSPKFFDTNTTLPPPPDKNICDNIRKLRNSPGDQGLVNELIAKNLFNEGRVASLRDQVSFLPEYNAYLTLKVGARTFRTGSPVSGPTINSWPCGDVGASSCDGDLQSLLCHQFQCGSPDQRRDANDRLARAVIAAKLTTWPSQGEKPIFVLPASFHFGVGPKTPTTQTSLTLDTFSIIPFTNAHWTLFEGDVPLGDAGVMHNLGGQTLRVARHGSADRTGFGPAGIPDGQLVDRFDDFFGGLSQGRASQGYFVNMLHKAAHSQVLPKSATGKISVGQPLQFLRSPIACADLVSQIVDKADLADISTDSFCQGGVDIKSIVDMGMDYTFTQQSLLDGLELLCEAGQVGPREGECGDFKTPVRLDTLADLNRMGSRLRCLGDRITRDAATTVFTQIPRRAVEVMKQQQATGTFSPLAGDMGKAESELRSALMQVSVSGPEIGRLLANFGEDMRILQATIENFANQDQIENVKFESAQAEQAARCAEEVAGAFSFTQAPWAGAAKAAAACVNSVLQIGFADRLRSLGQKSDELNREIAIAEFNKRFNDAAAALEKESTSLSEAMEGVNRQLGIIRSLQEQAKLSVNRAMWLLSFQAKNVGAVNSVLAARSQTSLVRYQQAHEHAKRLAFLAKRAVEQRIGMHLSDLRDDLPLVPAPATWESTLCSTSGIDFSKLVDSGGADLTSVTQGGHNFADSFIGDYVTKLENVVESYRLVYNFHEGADVAVISLRDDVLNVRKDCEKTSPNLLFHSAKLDFLSQVPRDDQHNWYPDGCPSGAPGDVPTCVGVTPRPDAPLAHVSGDVLSMPGYTLHFSQAGGALLQKVPVDPGRYRYSWYTLVLPNGGGVPVEDGGVDDSIAKPAGVVRSASGPVVPLEGTEGSLDAEGGWRRYFFSFEVNDKQDLLVGFTKAATGDLALAAPMLESVDTVLGRNAVQPRPFSRTDDTRTSIRPVCEDTDGATFRRTRWTRSCVKLCPDGYASDCEAKARTECYRETSFQLSQRGLEDGAILNQSGFARGNFNYRIDTIGLNFVGTGVRNCTDTNLPSTCYGGGFVPYSLEHQGPYLVRNHKGEDFRAALFTGSIEHARGLGIERYISNPMSSTDRTLLGDYLRRELQGRPLDGTFVLRVWDDEGVDFDAIQDVQLVLNYRYWTRFN